MSKMQAPAKFRKLPVEITAWQWNGSSEMSSRMKNWMGADNVSIMGVYFGIHTLEGLMQVNEGDYIIQGVKGEFYPCKPEIFLMTYEEVEE